MAPRYESTAINVIATELIIERSCQIFPTAVRARGLSLAASCGALGSVIVAQIWPVGIATLGSNIYFFFMAINLACVPVIYLFYPETKGRALEDMGVLFGSSPGSSTENLLADRADFDRLER